MNEEKKEEQVVSEQKASNPINKVKDDIKEVLNQPEQASSVGIDGFIRLSLILVLSALLIFIVWQFMIKPTIDFKNNEKIVEDAARRYYEFNYSQLPTGERVATLSIQQLYDKAFLTKDLYIPNSTKPCDSQNSWVKVRKENGEYKYYTYLKCGLQESDVDHEGPVIELNGKEEMTIGLGETYEEPGVKSVKDNEDGKLDPKDVVIKSSALNTNEVGEYEIKYIATDKLSNKTTITRKVKVIAKLKSIVAKDTVNANYYSGKEPNNYVYFSGMLWRIVDSDGKNVRLVAYEDIANVNYAGLNKWLDYFYDHLSDGAKKLIVKNKYCNETLSNATHDLLECSTQTKKLNSYILSAQDINKAHSEEGNYLITQTISWLANEQNDENAYTVDVFNYANGQSYQADLKTYNYGVRPVITIKGDSLIKSGTGTYKSPYNLGETPTGKVDDKINTRTPGEFIKYSGMLWRIVEVNKDGTTKIISMESIKSKDNIKVQTYYQSKSKVYNPTEKGNVGYFIKNKVSEYVDTSYFVNKNVEVPIYNEDIQYGKETSVKKYKVKLSAPNIYEMFSAYTYTLGNMKAHWLINSSKQEVTKAAMTDIGVIITTVGDYDKYGIRVVGNLNENIMITKGKGTFDNPYNITK